MILCF